MKLLVVDDDRSLTATLRRGLEAEGFTVDVAHDGVDGLWMAEEGTFDLVVLDLMLPGRNGYQVCAELRAAGDWTPILMLTAKSGDLDQTEAFETGADDYLVKPFSFAVLLARVRNLLRRAAARPPAPSSVGDLHLDPTTREVRRGDRAVELTTRQFQVLELLVRNGGAVVSKDDLLSCVWSHDFDGDPNIVEVYIRRLRRAIDEPFGRRSIETVRGAGYRLVDDRAGPR
ncbi:MAG: response regulator transcription factor [Actinomycetota bacterium]